MSSCLFCSSEIKIIKKRDKSKKFCNLSCASSFNLKRRIRTPETNKKISLAFHKRLKENKKPNKPKKYKSHQRCLVTNLCLNCKKPFNSTNKARLYCSSECQHLQKYTRDVLPKILSGKGAASTSIRRFLTDAKGYVCEICNISDWNDKKLMLQIDHIDGNSDNNRVENLRLLCPNCHSQTPTYKGGNKNKLKMTTRNVYHRNNYLKRNDNTKSTISP